MALAVLSVGHLEAVDAAREELGQRLRADLGYGGSVAVLQRHVLHAKRDGLDGLGVHAVDDQRPGQRAVLGDLGGTADCGRCTADDLWSAVRRMHYRIAAANR